MRTILTTTTAMLVGLASGLLATAWWASPTAADTTEGTPQVVVVDRTAGTWHGIRAAVTSWSASDHLDVKVAPRCNPARYCIVLQSPTAYDRDWIGYWQPISQHVSTIQLNSADTRAQDPNVQQWIACHEIGHALGLGEVYAGAPACMQDTPDLAAQQTTATDRDLAMLDLVATATAPTGSALAYHQSQAGTDLTGYATRNARGATAARL